MQRSYITTRPSLRNIVQYPRSPLRNCRSLPQFHLFATAVHYLKPVSSQRRTIPQVLSLQRSFVITGSSLRNVVPQFHLFAASYTATSLPLCNGHSLTQVHLFTTALSYRRSISFQRSFIKPGPSLHNGRSLPQVCLFATSYNTKSHSFRNGRLLTRFVSSQRSFITTIPSFHNGHSLLHFHHFTTELPQVHHFATSYNTTSLCLRISRSLPQVRLFAKSFIVPVPSL